MTANDALSLLGLALRAGKLEVGEEPVETACKAHTVKVVLLASDAAENSVKKAERFAAQSSAPTAVLPADKAELGFALGRKACAMAALTDAGFAATALKKLAAVDPERYGPLAEALSAAAEEEAKRRKDRQAAQRRKERLAAKPWAAPAQKKSARPVKK